MVEGVVIIAMRWIPVFGSKRKATKTTAPYFITVIFPTVSQLSYTESEPCGHARTSLKLFPQRESHTYILAKEHLGNGESDRWGDKSALPPTTQGYLCWGFVVLPSSLFLCVWSSWSKAA